MNKKNIVRFISLSILPITFYSVQYQSSLKIENTTFWWLLQGLILVVFWKAKNSFTIPQLRKSLLFIYIYIYFNIFNILRGGLIADNYWDWKGLIGNSVTLLIPIVAYAATNKFIVQLIFSFYCKYTLPLFFIIILFITTDVYGFYLIPVSFFMLFFPLLTGKWKIIVGALTLLVVLIDLNARSNVFRFLLPVLLMGTIAIKSVISLRVLIFFRRVLLMAPLIMLLLATTGIFNIFRISDYIEGNYSKISMNADGEFIEVDLRTDTRTSLYEEVLTTAKKYNSWLIGRSPAKGNDTELFAGLADITGKQERLSNEVAILNIFTWTGILGVILYFLVFSRATYLSIHKSNNYYIKIVGLYLAFRWVYAWVEDINSFTLNYIVLWLMIGICYSKQFREMNDLQMKYWIRGIFDKNYRKIAENNVNSKLELKQSEISNPLALSAPEL